MLPESGPDLRQLFDFFNPLELETVRVLPLAVFRDGFGRLRPAQIGACSFAELRDAIEIAAGNGTEHFVILSHNFEMLKPGRSERDSIVAGRFEQLCAFLAEQRGSFAVSTLAQAPIHIPSPPHPPLPHCKLLSTIRRHGEQLARRLT